ncbi:MAG: WYL domain-containing protein, partial [Clostridia bacterium]|nr:WYL domain-containing protein [Clostridia bacterium]
DTEGFEFYKKDGRTLNKNALLTKLIVNYHKRFMDEQNELLTYLKKSIGGSATISKKQLDQLCVEISEKINDRNVTVNGEKFNKLISLKPTKESEPIIDYIEKYLLMGRSLSEYFRNMLSSYASLPQDKREAIIFKPQYEAVLKAIQEKKKVFITTTNTFNNKFETAPYAITDSKEELHLYVIGVQKACNPIRLSRIISVTQLSADATFTDEQRAMAERMIEYGPQFIYKPYEKEVLIELTAKGIDKYKRMYVHRPIPVRINNNHYFFHCSHSQIVQYFVRFGAEAKVIYPQSVRDEIISFHRKALMRYTNKEL